MKQDPIFNPDLEAKTKFIPMEDLDVTSADDEKPYVGTTSLASCAGIAIYDFDHKVGGVAHVFFNEKETDMWYYQQTGKIRYIEKPNAFLDFQWLAEALVRRADEIGGERYKFMVFNVDHGCRRPEQNRQLKEVVERTIAQLKQSGKITDAEYRHEQDFRLDTKTGAILPYH